MRKINILILIGIAAAFNIKCSRQTTQSLVLESPGANGQEINALNYIDNMVKSTSSGTFTQEKATINIINEGLYWINHNPVYVSSGDLVTITYEQEGENKLFRKIKEIKGADSKVNQLFFEIKEQWHSMSVASVSKEGITASDITNKFTSLNNYITKTTSQKDICAIALYYNKACAVSQIASFIYDSYVWNTAFDTIINSFDINSPSISKLSEDFVSNLLKHYSRIRLKQMGDTKPTEERIVEFMAMNVNNPAIVDEQIKLYINYNFSFEGFNERLIKLLPLLKEKISDSILLKEVIDKEKSHATAKVGDKAPEIIAEDKQGNIIKVFDFIGKVVVIDMWATWCKVCIQHLPDFFEMRDSYKDNSDIVFITLSTDRDEAEDKWKAFLKKHKMTGINIRPSGVNAEKFRDDFKIVAVPRYVIIDRDGNLASSNGKFDKDKLSLIINNILK